MTETIQYMLGALSVAGVLAGINAYLERHSQRFTRITLYRALGKHCMVKAAGLVAQREAEEKARGLKVDLV